MIRAYYVLTLLRLVSPQVLLDWCSSGRRARGEAWAFASYESRTEARPARAPPRHVTRPALTRTRHARAGAAAARSRRAHLPAACGCAAAATLRRGAAAGAHGPRARGGRAHSHRAQVRRGCHAAQGGACSCMRLRDTCVCAAGLTGWACRRAGWRHMLRRCSATWKASRPCASRAAAPRASPLRRRLPGAPHRRRRPSFSQPAARWKARIARTCPRCRAAADTRSGRAQAARAAPSSASRLSRRTTPTPGRARRWRRCTRSWAARRTGCEPARRHASPRLPHHSA